MLGACLKRGIKIMNTKRVKIMIAALALIAGGAQAEIVVAIPIPSPDSVFTIINSARQTVRVDMQCNIKTIILGSIFVGGEPSREIIYNATLATTLMLRDKLVGGEPTREINETKNYSINLGSGGEFVWRIAQKKACLQSVRINGGPNILEPLTSCLESVTVRILPPLSDNEVTGGTNVQVIHSSQF